MADWLASLDPRARYALETLATVGGIDLSECGPDDGSGPAIVYGCTDADIALGRPRLLIPRDDAAWAGRFGQSSGSPSWQVVDELRVTMNSDVLGAAYHFLSLSFEQGAARDKIGRVPLQRLSPGVEFVSPDCDSLVGAFLDAFFAAASLQNRLSVQLAAWPDLSPFAANLSHDIDRVFDRELFSLISDGAKLARAVRKGGSEAGRWTARLVRSLVRPRPPGLGMDSMHDIENTFGFRSTSFFLEDRYWARHGAQYRFSDSTIRELAASALDRGAEVAIHGGFYDFNSRSRYLAACESFAESFGFLPHGIRNHYLRFSGAKTWHAQAGAGLRYDATLGYHDTPGFRSRISFPHRAFDADSRTPIDLTVIPLTVMDGTVCPKGSEAASRSIHKAIASARSSGGLATFLWHNNYFADPDFVEWVDAYRELLNALFLANAWVATAREIDEWWRARGTVRLRTRPEGDGRWILDISSTEPIQRLGLTIRSHHTVRAIRGDIQNSESGTSRTLIIDRISASRPASIVFGQ